MPQLGSVLGAFPGYSEGVGQAPQVSSAEGSASRLTHVGVGKIQFLTGSCIKGLRSLLAIGRRSSLNSLTHELLHRAAHNMAAGFSQREKQGRVSKMEAAIF